MSRRIERINQLIRKEISQLLQRDIKDPRLKEFISVNEVNTTPDLKNAKVFVSSIGSDEEKEEALKALSTASGFIRGELFKRLDLRYVPELSFQWDDSIERGVHLMQLIDSVEHDEEDKTGRNP